MIPRMINLKLANNFLPAEVVADWRSAVHTYRAIVVAELSLIVEWEKLAEEPSALGLHHSGSQHRTMDSVCKPSPVGLHSVHARTWFVQPMTVGSARESCGHWKVPLLGIVAEHSGINRNATLAQNHKSAFSARPIRLHNYCYCYY